MRLNKRGGMVSEIVVLVILFVIFFSSAPAIANFTTSILFGGKSPEDQRTLEHFNNLVDELNDIIEDEGAYSIEESIPMDIASRYGVIAFNGDARSTPVFYYYYTDECYRNERNAGYPCRYFNLGYFTKPASCEGFSCLCLVKKANGKKGDINTVYEVNNCTNFPENVVFYSWMHHTASWEGYENTWFSGTKLFYHFFFSNMNYGVPFSRLDFHSFENISFTNTSWMVDENFDPANYYISGGDELPGFISSYSTLFFGGTPPVDDAEILFEIDGFKSRSLYVDKIDFSKLRGDNDKIHVFLNPSPYYDNVNDARKKTLAGLEYKDVEDYSNLIGKSDDYYKLYYFLDYVMWLTNPLFEGEPKEDIVNFGLDVLNGVKEAITRRIELCEDETTSEIRNDCLQTYSYCRDEGIRDKDGCRNVLRLSDAALRESCEEYEGLYMDFFTEYLDKGFIEQNPIDECLDLFRPKAMNEFLENFIVAEFNLDMLELIIENAEVKEDQGLYLLAYGMYLAFIEENIEEFYHGGAFDFEVLRTKYSLIGFLSKAMEVKYSNPEVSKSQVGEYSNVYLVEGGGSRYLFIPVKKSILIINAAEEFDIDSLSSEEDVLALGEDNIMLEELDYYSEYYNQKENLYLALEIMAVLQNKGCISNVEINAEIDDVSFIEDYEACGVE